MNIHCHGFKVGPAVKMVTDSGNKFTARKLVAWRLGPEIAGRRVCEAIVCVSLYNAVMEEVAVGEQSDDEDFFVSECVHDCGKVKVEAGKSSTGADSFMLYREKEYLPFVVVFVYPPNE